MSHDYKLTLSTYIGYNVLGKYTENRNNVSINVQWPCIACCTDIYKKNLNYPESIPVILQRGHYIQINFVTCNYLSF